MTERTETRPLALDRSSGITSPSPYLRFTAEEWGRLRAATPLTLTEPDLERLRGINVALSLRDVAEIMLPLSRLLNLYVGASQELYRASDTFLGKLPGKWRRRGHANVRGIGHDLALVFLVE